MCGIAGFAGRAGYDDAGSQAAINIMLERMRHRGPDGHGHWNDAGQGVTLGHGRLAIVDTSEAGRQPMHLGSLHAVVNGEIYNYPELRTDLETRYGARFTSNCDSEIVLHGFACEGEAFFARMNGMFAAALFDAATGTLRLLRDRAGIKPVYYCHDAGTFYFASEIKGLLAPLGASRWPIDLEGLSQYLCFQTAFAGRTLFAGVSLLLPGHMLTLQTDTPEAFVTASYIPRENAEVPIDDFQEAVTAYTEVFDASVRRHLLSDVPVASYVSAGLDSASVATAAAHILKPPMTAFTGRFPQETGWYDETVAAAAAVKAFGGMHQVVDITPKDLETQLDAVIDALDEPKMGMGAFSQYMVARKVAGRFKVILTGHGGDELFAGYPIFKLCRLSTLLHLKRSELPHVAYFILSLLRRLFQPEFGRFLPVLWSRRMQERLLGRTRLKTRPWEALARLQASRRGIYAQIDATYRYEYLPNLLVVEDKISMAHSIESRTPFLDNEMAALSRRIAIDAKLAHGTLKAIVRSHARNRLPRIYFSQPKRGFPTPLRRWLRGECHGFLVARLLGQESALSQIMVRAEIEKEVARYTKSWFRHIRPLDEIQSYRMWQLLSLESWLRLWKQRYGIQLELNAKSMS